jgi:protein tyrosine phosphatase
MSFLSDLRTKRHSLRHTTTTLTYLDGRKFEESGSETRVEVPKAQFGFIVDTKPDNVPAKVADHVYLGSQDCCDSEILKNYEISYVLSVGVEAPMQCEGTTYKFVQCLDLAETNLLNILEESVIFIGEAVQKRSNVLVHCNAGVSRSASVVIGYLILVGGYEYFDAHRIVKNARNCIRPNDGFVEQLKKLSSR